MKPLILFQGDSITDVSRNRDNDHYAGHGYPTLVKARLGYDAPGRYEFLNRGVSGNRVVDLYARIKMDIINLKPDYLSILIGVNDVWHEVSRQNGVNAAKFRRVYDMLLCEVREALPGIRLLILEPFVLPGTATMDTEEAPDRLTTFQREVALRAEAAREVAAVHGACFVPLQRRFDQAACGMDPAYWLIDGVHPSAMGHELIARAWMEGFNSLCAGEEM